MKVHYIGNFAVDYSTESHVALSLEALGHDVVKHQEQDVDWRWVPAHADGDFVLWTHTHGFADESKHEQQDVMLDGLRARGIPTVAYHLDRWAGLEREHQLAEPYFQCDLVCTADGGHQELFEQLGINHVWMPPAVVHTETVRGHAQSRYVKDVGFVGTWMKYGHRDVWPWRFDLVAHLSKRYRSRFRSWPRGNRPIRGSELNDLYASVRVIVGDSCLAGSVERYWSDRVPETLGRGGFLLHPDVVGLDEQFPMQREVNTSRIMSALPWRFDVGDLDAVDNMIEAALSLSDDDRNALIDEAVSFVAAHHTYKARMERVVELVKEL
jgi:hypothetical protein